MAAAPNPGPSVNVAAAGTASVGIWRLLAVAAPHLAALAVMLRTETDFGSRVGFLLAWGILNFFFIALLRRPALSGALSLTLVVLLILRIFVLLFRILVSSRMLLLVFLRFLRILRWLLL